MPLPQRSCCEGHALLVRDSSAASERRGIRSRPQRARRTSSSAGGIGCPIRLPSAGCSGATSVTLAALTANSQRSPHAVSEHRWLKIADKQNCLATG